MVINRKQKEIDATSVKSGKDDAKYICRSAQIKAIGTIKAITVTDLSYY
jgi:hypothetical protein